ncbi:hypothetical protein [Sphingobium sp. B2]|uniref:hypothetical protein n=1 Tax=Sphingobium sp. B2 TaxID=2583228 RepID=UPI0016439303|nr:hypothetical protein [Sphingobium sp. B2]
MFTAPFLRSAALQRRISQAGDFWIDRYSGIIPPDPEHPGLDDPPVPIKPKTRDRQLDDPVGPA